MNFITCFFLVTIFRIVKDVHCAPMVANEEEDHVSIPLIDASQPSTAASRLFRSVSYIPDVVTIKNVNGALEYEVNDLLLCEQNLDSNIIVCSKEVKQDQDDTRGGVPQFGQGDVPDRDIRRIIGNEIEETMDKPVVSKHIPASHMEHIKYLLEREGKDEIEEGEIVSSKSKNSNEGDSSYISVMPLSIYLPGISDFYADNCMMYINVDSPVIIEVVLDSFYSQDCSWSIHSIFQRDFESGNMIDITWGVSYYNKIDKNIVVSEPNVSYKKRHRRSFFGWFRSDVSAVVISSNIHIMDSGTYSITYSHKCKSSIDSNNLIRTLNIQASKLYEIV